MASLAVTPGILFVAATATHELLGNRFSPDIVGQHAPPPLLPVSQRAPGFMEDIAAAPTRSAPARTTCVRCFMC